MNKINILSTENNRKSFLLVLLLIFYGIFSWSLPIYSFGITGGYILPVTAVLLLFVVIHQHRHLKKKVVVVWLFSFFLTMIAAAYWANAKVFVLPIAFLVAFALTFQSERSEISLFVDISSKIIFLIMVGALVGFFIAFANIQPLFSFAKSDGKLVYFFYTTLTSDKILNIIRPSGIYDEPGALSFVVCILAYLRARLNKSSFMTWLLLVMGMVTFSFAHFVFIAVFFFSERISKANFNALVFVGLLVVLLIVQFPFIVDIFQTKIWYRMEIDEFGNFSGDNRINFFQVAFSALMRDPISILMGIDFNCVVNAQECEQFYGHYGENPLSPMFVFGLLNSWPYYLFMVIGLAAIVRGRSGLAFFSVAILFAQRPYLMSLGYSLLGLMALRLHLSPITIRR